MSLQDNLYLSVKCDILILRSTVKKPRYRQSSGMALKTFLRSCKLYTCKQYNKHQI